MIIKNIKTTDISEYTLVATNKAGESKQKVKLSLHGKILKKIIIIICNR